MKVGTENKKKTILAGVLVVLAAVLLYRAFSGNGNEDNAAATQPVATGHAAAKVGHKPHGLLAHSLDPTLRFDLLRSSEDVTYKGTGRNIFSSLAAAPPEPIPSPSVNPDTSKQGPPPPPPPPPIELKFYGYAGPRNGAKRIFLLKGEDIFLAREGDIVDRRYKVLHIGPTSVQIEDVLTNNTQTISMGAG